MNKIFNTPLCITEEGARNLRGLAMREVQLPVQAEKDKDLKKDVRYTYLGNKMPEPYAIGSTAVIPIEGPMVHGMGVLGDFLEMADMDEIKGWIQAAAADPEVERIALAIRSPGGMAIGAPELSETVRQATEKKPVMAFTDEMMASAAYFAGVAADAIYATPSAIVGSVGTYLTLVDDSEYWKRQGVEFIVLRSGDYKGAGIDGYTEEQLAEKQALVDAIDAQFKSAVSTARGHIESLHLQGQVFLGIHSVNTGFTDFLAQDLNHAIEHFTNLTQTHTNYEPSPTT